MPRKPRRKLTERTAVAYIRVSTDAERQKLGLRAQVVAIRAWARREGVRIVRWRAETVSGGAALDERPRLIRALADVEATGSAFLVVHRVDRFSRDPLSAALAEAALERAGAALAVAEGAGAGSDPTSELVRSVLVAVGRFERKLTAARIKAALAVKQARGEMTGAPPFGMRLAADGVHLEADPAEQDVIGLVVQLRAGGGTVRAIEQGLTERGIVGRAGRPLTRDAVHKIIQRHAGESDGT